MLLKKTTILLSILLIISCSAKALDYRLSGKNITVTVTGFYNDGSNFYKSISSNTVFYTSASEWIDKNQNGWKDLGGRAPGKGIFIEDERFTIQFTENEVYFHSKDGVQTKRGTAEFYEKLKSEAE